MSAAARIERIDMAMEQGLIDEDPAWLDFYHLMQRRVLEHGRKLDAATIKRLEEYPKLAGDIFEGDDFQRLDQIREKVIAKLAAAEETLGFDFDPGQMLATLATTLDSLYQPGRAEETSRRPR